MTQSARTRPRILRLALLAAAVAAVLPSWALPRIHQKAQVVLQVDVVLVAPPAGGRTVATRTLPLDGTDPRIETLSVDWPGESAPRALTVSAVGRFGSEKDDPVIALTTALTLPTGRIVRTESSYSIPDGSSRLVEVFAAQGTRLLLALRAERELRPVLSPSTDGVVQVRFRVEVQRMQGEQVHPLETNVLDTFLGEPVEYSFERGEGDDLETMRVSLLPVRIEGSIAEVEVVIDGTLPAPTNRIVVSRRERLITTRGSASAVSVLAGEPPTGYRFEIRPDW